MAQLPHFFHDSPLTPNSIVSLDTDTARHIAQVLRMKPGEQLSLTDGNGGMATGTILAADKNKCSIQLLEVESHEASKAQLHVIVAFTKNTSRNEWLLEKATELGVASIIPVDATRSEKTHIRIDRWQKILQSALLQSRQYFLPHLAEVTPLKKALDNFKDKKQKFIAHCIPGQPRHTFSEMLNPASETVILIGPEGDFTPDEVNLATQLGYLPVSLGSQRLRTETAAIAAAAYFNVFNDGKN